MTALEEERNALQVELDERNSVLQKARLQKSDEKQAEIDKKYKDQSERAHASTSFAGWQRKMEILNVHAGKRNIVNTYVWDGDGGFHAEEQQFASTVEHSIGGSFDFRVALGGQGSFAFAKVLVEASAYANVNLTQTMSKTEASSKGMELHVDLSGVEDAASPTIMTARCCPAKKSIVTGL